MENIFVPKKHTVGEIQPYVFQEGIKCKLSHMFLFVCIIATAAAVAFGTAGAAVRTADTFFTAFFGFVNVKSGKP